jgi:hypothetical protein
VLQAIPPDTAQTCLDRLNQTTREVAKENQVLLIDLAREMPNSAKYFYDPIHYTDAGSELVANIVASKLALEIIRHEQNVRGGKW